MIGYSCGNVHVPSGPTLLHVQLAVKPYMWAESVCENHHHAHSLLDDCKIAHKTSVWENTCVSSFMCSVKTSPRNASLQKLSPFYPAQCQASGSEFHSMCLCLVASRRFSRKTKTSTGKQGWLMNHFIFSVLSLKCAWWILASADQMEAGKWNNNTIVQIFFLGLDVLSVLTCGTVWHASCPCSNILTRENRVVWF